MSLFTDSNHVTQADLVALDPQIAEIAIAEEFTVSALIARAWDECAEIIQRACASEYGEFTDPVLAYHTGGWPSGVQLSRIVVTSPYANSASTLQRGMTWKAIEVSAFDMVEGIRTMRCGDARFPTVSQPIGFLH